ncbi:MAG TPA: flavoprotein, partial [Acidobacteriaceae bacterium]|nr:flavoprotein [Acidobacteriaceae bacterium]
MITLTHEPLFLDFRFTLLVTIFRFSITCETIPLRPLMTQPKILVGVTGGVAAYKAAELVRALQQRGAEVRVAMTRGAQEFIQPLTFSSITGHQTITTMWAEGTEPSTGLDDEGQIEHISVAQWANAIVIAPA